MTTDLEMTNGAGGGVEIDEDLHSRQASPLPVTGT
jgi:hypothetical protein